MTAAWLLYLLGAVVLRLLLRPGGRRGKWFVTGAFAAWRRRR